MQNTDMTIKDLEHKALHIRESIITSLLKAGSGHSAGPLGMVEMLVALYFEVLQHNPKDPHWDKRDRVVLSNGHTCPGFYATLAHAGYFPKEELAELRKFGSRLQGHPHFGALPGIENASGPLGQGLSQALGMGLAFKQDKKNNRVYCLMGDGEQQEGQNWEAYWFGARHNINNVTVIIDRNNIQIDGYTEDVMPLEPLREKIKSFGWHVLEVDGHNIEAIIDCLNQAKATQQKPTAIICNTIPGKGVEFMENLPEWHGKPPTAKEAKKALISLKDQHGRKWHHHE